MDIQFFLRLMEELDILIVDEKEESYRIDFDRFRWAVRDNFLTYFKTRNKSYKIADDENTSSPEKNSPEKHCFFPYRNNINIITQEKKDSLRTKLDNINIISLSTQSGMRALERASGEGGVNRGEGENKTDRQSSTLNRRQQKLVSRPSSLEDTSSIHQSKDNLISSQIKNILDMWKANKLHVPRSGTKAEKNDRQIVKDYLSGNLWENEVPLDRFSALQEAISRFRLAAFDPEFSPRNLETKKYYQKFTIGKFISNPFGANETRSLFLRYFKNPPQRSENAIQLKEDLYPELTVRIREFYKKQIGSTGRISNVDENRFRLASSRLVKFLSEHRDKFLDPYMNKDKLILFYLESISQGVRKINSMTFIYDSIFDNVLPTYLNEQGVTKGGDYHLNTEGKKERPFSIYQKL